MIDKIIFTISHPFVLRNFLFSGLASEIENNLGFQVHFVSPYINYSYTDQKKRSFINHYIDSYNGSFGVPNIKGVTSIENNIRNLHMKGFSIEYSNGSLMTMNFNDKRDLTWYLAKTLISLTPRHSKRRSFLRELYSLYRPKRKKIAAIFDEIKPKMVVVGSPGHYWLDLFIMDEANRRKIPSICIISSWDNIYSRGPFHRRPNFLMVWSEEMKRQALEVQQFPKDRIYIVGALQMRFHGEAVTEHEKVAMRKKIGLNQNEKYIAYVCGAQTMRYDVEDIQAMAASLSIGSFSDLRLVVRPHPQGNRDLYNRLRKNNILLDPSPDITDAKPRPDSFNLKNIRHMVSFLTDAEFVVSSWGTTALLEACVFDTPAIQLRWMDSVRHHYPEEVDKVRKFQRYIHMKAFDETCARLYCDSPQELNDIMKFMKQENEVFAAKRALAVNRLICLPLNKVLDRIITGMKSIQNLT